MLASARGVRTSIVVLFVVAVTLRALTLISPVIDVDEAWFAASAAGLSSPRDFFMGAMDNKPPGTVWVFWLLDRFFATGADPRTARGASIVASLAVAWIVSCFAKERARRPVTALVCFLAISLPSPKLTAATTESFVLPLICLAMLLCWRDLEGESPRRPGLVAASALLGIGLIFKQTVVFFVPVLLCTALWLWREKRLAATTALTAVVASLAPLLFVASWLGWDEFWRWTWFYPGQVLEAVRARLFSRGAAFGVNALFFAVALWPLFADCGPQAWRKLGDKRVCLLGLWMAGAIASVVIGNGLFLHYFQFLVPPLCVLYAFSKFDRRVTLVKSLWMHGGHALGCVLAAVPSLAVFWGVDLAYYERLGELVREHSAESERVFVWGGNAVPLVFADRPRATGFVTARFAAPPYGTHASGELFKKQFRADPPAFFLDLHERGDERFNTPVSALPWLARELRAHYARVDDGALPWARLYRRVALARMVGTRRLAVSGVERAPAPRAFSDDDFYQDLKRALGDPFSQEAGWRSAVSWLRYPRRALAIESLVRAWEGARALGEPKIEARLRRITLRAAGALARGSDSDLAEDSAFVEGLFESVKHEFIRRGEPLPLALCSRAWWVSFALVKLQPVAWPQKG